MSNKLDQMPLLTPTKSIVPERKSLPEVVLIKDHPHLILGPHHPLAQSPQPETGHHASELISPQNILPEEQIMKAVGLYKTYRKGPAEVPVLRNLNLEIRRGEFIAIVGQSGSGKSTLLHLLAALDSPDQGEIHFGGRRIDTLSAADCDALRNKRLGMIFQFYHLLPEFSTLENVLAPLMIVDGIFSYFLKRKKHKAAALDLLETLGLSHRLKHKPRELSGGRCNGQPLPGPWSPSPRSSWPTNPPEISIKPPARRS